jgi:hypothetical protein
LTGTVAAEEAVFSEYAPVNKSEVNISEIDTTFLIFMEFANRSCSNYRTG